MLYLPKMSPEAQVAYGTALMRIEECRKLGIAGTFLGLRDLGLTLVPPEIGQLSELKKLDLSANLLTSLPSEIGFLTKLTALNLGSNNLTDLPLEMAQLSSLVLLELYNNRFTRFPSVLMRLKTLRELSFGSNHLKTLSDEIGQLTELRELSIYGNQLTSLSPAIGRLISLRKLYLSDNQLTSLPPEIGQLTSLRELYLFNNQLTSLPPELGQLFSLTQLSLYNNRLTALPSEIGELRALKELRVQDNQLASLPPEIVNIESLRELYLHGNLRLGIPDEVLGPIFQDVVNWRGSPKIPGDILHYYFRIRPALKMADPRLARQEVELSEKGLAWIQTHLELKPAVQVREARLIVIGDGAAGKTSLVRALLHDHAARADEGTTRDVIVEDWPGVELSPPNENQKQPVAVHVWDFGGQEPMHAAHPYFFTNRTLYLVVATARESGVEERISYWLKMVAAHGQGARALVAVNKTDEHPMDIAQRDLCYAHRACLPENTKEAFFATSCKKGKVKGIAALRKALLAEVARMDQVWAEVPGEWMDAKRLLEDRRAQDDDTLSFEDWDKLCDEAKVPEKERETALHLLRDLGTVVSFPGDRHLGGLGVLNPSWVTRAIYPLLSSHELAAKGGLLEPDGLAALLDDAKRYPKHKHEWLIKLMTKFELLFENEGRLLLPARLPKDAPDWACAEGWSKPEVLRLELRFTVLPESIISKFITRRHGEAAFAESWWRHGIAVKDDSGRCQALVRAYVGDPGRIELRVSGPKAARQHFVAVLRDEFRSLTKRLDGELWLLLDGIHPQKYDDLLQLVHEAGMREITSVVDRKVRTFDLVKHLDLIEPPAAQQQALANITLIGRDAISSAVGPGSKVVTQDSFKS